MANETVVTVIGNLTSDPETRQAGGASVVSFTIASTPRTFDKQSNEWKDGEALFLRASAWRELGEHVAASLTKGSRVIAQGRLSQRSYEKDGVKRQSVELEVDAIGPELRYATVSVERAGGNRNQAARQEQFRAQQGPQDARTFQQQPSNSWPAQGAAAYDDETPF